MRYLEEALLGLIVCPLAIASTTKRVGGHSVGISRKSHSNFNPLDRYRNAEGFKAP
jgi:hypothetical protein